MIQAQATFSIDEAMKALGTMPGLTLMPEEPLTPYTLFRSGGPADLLILPQNRDSLVAVKRLCLQEGWPLTVLGRASNVLVSDQGIRGLTLLLSPGMGKIRREGDRLCCEAGAPLYEVAAFAARQSLTGFEFASGIPGSIGGAVFMNAGAFEGSMADRVVRTLYLDGQGELREIQGEDHDFGYRHSYFSDRPETLILETCLSLEKGEPQAIYDRMGILARKRYLSQPLDRASAGSAFRRPPGYFAGKLISDAGMKGYRRGQAGVSGKHAGFIVNYGGASSSEILQIFLDVRKAVYEEAGVQLQAEVRLIGDWESDPLRGEEGN